MRPGMGDAGPSGVELTVGVPKALVRGIEGRELHLSEGLARAGGRYKKLIVVSDFAFHTELLSRQLEEGHARLGGAVRKQGVRPLGNRYVYVGPGDHVGTDIER